MHGTLTVLAVARDADVRGVVNASSSSVYGGADRDLSSHSDVSAFVEALGFEKIFGDERELNGYPSFDAQYVLSELSELLYGTYPACAQLLILERP